jgi:hypothetical protein
VSIFVGADHAEFPQYFLDITKAQSELKGEPHGLAGDLHLKAMVPVGSEGCG